MIVDGKISEIYRRDQMVSNHKIWRGSIGLSAPWAHPVWSEYMMFVYDLTFPGRKTPFLINPKATHEFLLYAVDPETKIDFNKNLLKKPYVKLLQPANYGYQFHCENNEEAWQFVINIADHIEAKQINPDTDFSANWNLNMRMLGAWSLKDNGDEHGPRH